MVIPGLDDWTCEVRLSIGASQVAVILSSEDEVEDLASLRNAATNLVEDVSGLFAYTSGHAYSVEITNLTTHDHDHVVFGVTHPVIETLEEERHLDLDGRLVELALQNSHLARAIGDLRRSILEKRDTGFHCYRAVESLRHHFQQVSGARDAAWRALRTALVVERATLDRLKGYGDPQRHGEVGPSASDEREDAIRITWRLINRFIAYLDGDEVPLSSAQYPLI